MEISKIENWVFYFLCGFALFSSTSIAIGNIFLSLTIAAGALRLWKKHDDVKELIRVDKALAYPFLLFVAAMVFTSLFSTDMVNSLRTVSDHYLYRATAFYMVLMFIRDKKKILTILLCGFLSHIANDLVCNYQGMVEDSFRAEGLIGIMMTAHNLDMWIPVIVLGIMANPFKGKWKHIYGLCCLIAFGALIYNGTRGVWVAMALIIPVLLLLYMESKAKAAAAIVAIAILIGGIFATVPALYNRVATISDTNMQSNSERLLLWQSARNMYFDYMLTGVGYANFGTQYHEKYILPEAKEPELGHAHSNFFQVLAESGTIGTITFLIWCLGTLQYCVMGWLQKKNVGYLAMLGIFLGIMLQGLTEYTMGASMAMKLFWLLIGLSYQWIQLSRSEN